MTAPKEWPPEAREAVAHAMRQALYPGRILSKWEDHQREYWGAQADAALAALAPFVAQIEAAAFKRGAEAMREKVAADIAHAVNDPGACAVEQAVCRALVISTRALPIPEDKP